MKNELCTEMNCACEYIFLIFFYNSRLNFCSHRKEAFLLKFFCLLLISPFSQDRVVAKADKYLLDQSRWKSYDRLKIYRVCAGKINVGSYGKNMLFL